MTAHLRAADSDPPSLSVVIPCLNEAQNLPALLGDLNRQRRLHLEILVADGGSTDNSTEIARRHGARVVESDAGRGRQMNTAARQARADWLLFLHADSRLGDIRLLGRALRALQLAQAQSEDKAGQQRIAGHFQLQFIRDNPRHQRLLFRYMQAKTALNRPYCVNGDQGLLLHRDYFTLLGGYDESLPFLEDLRLAERITHKGAHNGRFITLPGQLQTSARRFETEGTQRYLLMALIVIAEAADIPEFFEQSTRLYQSQDKTGRLLLTPYFRLYANIARQRGLRGSWRALLNIGRLARHHWWQLLFFCDVALGLQRRPFLWTYDHLIQPLIANPMSDALTAIEAWIVGMWILRPYFRLREHRALKEQANDRHYRNPAD